MKNIIPIFLLCISINVSAQLQTSFNFGSISLDANNSNSFSGPVIISSDKSCLQLFNGTHVFSARAKGGALFNPTCESNTRDIHPSFVIAPNPSPGLAKLYLTNNGILSEDKIIIILNDITGKIVQEYSCKGSQLREGFELNTNRIAKGMYFIKVIAKFPTNSNISLPQSLTSLKLINIHN
jgi:hypothetical protein